MSKLPTRKEVQIILEDGSVMDFLSSAGDKITMHNDDTQLRGDDHVAVKYYTVVIVAKEDVYDAREADKPHR